MVALILSIISGSLFYQKVETRYKRGPVPKSELTSSLRNRIVAVSLTFALPVVLFVSVDRSASLAFDGVRVPIPEKIPPWEWDNKCKFFSTEKIVNTMPCKYGNFDYGESVLLIGDSHAASISQAVVKLGAQNSWNVYVFTYLGCGFVTSKTNFESEYSYPYLTPKCLQHNRAILDFVETYKPEVVIWSHRSSSIFVQPNDFRGRTQYNKLVARDIRKLNKLAPVINVGSGPELVTSLTRVQDLFNNVSFFSKIPWEDSFFWKNSSATSYFFDSLKLFCKNGQCKNRSKDAWLFHDADHLSTQGAELLIPGLESVVKKILQRDSGE